MESDVSPGIAFAGIDVSGASVVVVGAGSVVDPGSGTVEVVPPGLEFVHAVEISATASTSAGRTRIDLGARDTTDRLPADLLK